MVAVRYLTRLQESYIGTFCNLFVTHRDGILTPGNAAEEAGRHPRAGRIPIADVNSSPPHSRD